MNTTEIRKQIFPRYIGSDFVTSMEGFEHPKRLFSVSIERDGASINREPYVLNLKAGFHIGLCCLLLRSIESITDEDAIEMAKLFGGVEGEIKINRMDSNNEDCYYVAQIFTQSPKYTSFCIPKNIEDHFSYAKHQYLQLKGYALPQFIMIDGKPVTISVTEQIELGIIKIK